MVEFTDEQKAEMAMSDYDWAKYAITVKGLNPRDVYEVLVDTCEYRSEASAIMRIVCEDLGISWCW